MVPSPHPTSSCQHCLQTVCPGGGQKVLLWPHCPMFLNWVTEKDPMLVLVRGTKGTKQSGLIYKNEPYPPPLYTTSTADKSRDFPGCPVAKTSHFQCKGWGGVVVGWLGSISGQGTRSHMPQLKILHVVTKKSCIPQWRSKILHATTKTRHSQRNKLKIKKYKNDRCFMTHSGAHQSN